MTESDWAACDDPARMLQWLRGTGRASERKLRLFACACVRRVWWLLEDYRSQRAVEVRERFDDGLADANELSVAAGAAGQARNEIRAPFRFAPEIGDESPEAASPWAAAAASNAATGSYHAASKAAARAAACLRSSEWEAAYATELSAQAALLRDLLGPLPFRIVALDPAWLTWNDGVVGRVAQAIYDERAFDRLPVLADVLEESGCAEKEILTHLRGPGPHVLGCWALDTIPGKS